jgi:hypothetical protein
LLLSTFLPALATGIIAFILYVVGNVGGLVEQLGHAIGSQTMINIGVVTSLIIPSDALWKMAAGALQPPTTSLLANLRAAAGPFSVLNPPSAWMALYAFAYLVIALLGAMAIFQERDL